MIFVFKSRTWSIWLRMAILPYSWKCVYHKQPGQQTGFFILFFKRWEEEDDFYTRHKNTNKQMYSFRSNFRGGWMHQTSHRKSHYRNSWWCDVLSRWWTLLPNFRLGLFQRSTIAKYSIVWKFTDWLFKNIYYSKQYLFFIGRLQNLQKITHRYILEINLPQIKLFSWNSFYFI